MEKKIQTRAEVHNKVKLRVSNGVPVRALCIRPGTARYSRCVPSRAIARGIVVSVVAE